MLHANASILEQKKAKVAAVAEEMKNAKSFVFVNFSGIPVEDDTKLRRELREAGVKYEVVKNSILNFALKEAGFEELSETLAGCTAIASCDSDAVAPARILYNYAKKHENFQLKGGVVEGKVVDSAAIIDVAKLPTREVLIAIVLGTLQAPISGLARALDQIREKQSA